MKTVRHMYWQDGDMWIGYLEEFPDYMTQGETLDELQENLKDVHADLTGGMIPAVRRVAELQVTWNAANSSAKLRKPDAC